MADDSTALAVAFADLAGFTALTEVHGDTDAAGVAMRFYELARKSLRGDTRIVKPIGDAVMLAGPDLLDVADTLLSLGAVVELEPSYPSMRAGIHYGPVVVRDGDLFGSTVNVAARVAAHARSGQILCTAAVRDALGLEPRVHVQSIGAFSFKNVGRAMELFEVAGSPPSVDFALDPVCRMHVDRRTCHLTLEHDGRVVCFCSEGCRDTFAETPDRYSS